MQYLRGKRVVLKLGTRVVTGEDGGLARDRLRRLIIDLDNGLDEDGRFLIVSSGAVGLGARQLGLQGKKLNLSQKQACASVGQSLLINAYQEILDECGHIASQVLVSADDLADRERYLNLRNALHEILDMKAVPVINENDCVSTAELREHGQEKSFGDNDKLSALIAAKMEADLLIILTDVDGLYTENPKLVKEAVKIGVVFNPSELGSVKSQGKSELGRGGMATKIEACKIAAAAGVSTVIASGFREDVVHAILKNRGISDDARPGSLVLAKRKISPRKRWIGYSSEARGALRINEGAVRAIVEKHASLLPSGIVDVLGEFRSGEVVNVCDPHGSILGRGIVNFNHLETIRIRGRKVAEAQDILQRMGSDVVIRSDNLVLFEGA